MQINSKVFYYVVRLIIDEVFVGFVLKIKQSKMSLKLETVKDGTMEDYIQVAFNNKRCVY